MSVETKKNFSLSRKRSDLTNQLQLKLLANTSEVTRTEQNKKPHQMSSKLIPAFTRVLVYMWLIWSSYCIGNSFESRRFIKGLLLGALISRAGGNGYSHPPPQPHYYPLPY